MSKDFKSVLYDYRGNLMESASKANPKISRGFGDITQSYGELSTKIEELQVERMFALDNAIKSGDPAQIVKAHRISQQTLEAHQPKGGKSFIFDPMMLNEQMGYKSTPSQVTYELLRQMASTPVVKSIVGTRVEQAAAYCSPQTVGSTAIGWSIRKKVNVFDAAKENITSLNDQEKREVEVLIEFLENSGLTSNDNSGEVWGRDDFDAFIRKIVKDSLELDQATFEIVDNYNGLPTQFYATDGSTFRLAKSFFDGDGDAPLKIHGCYPQFVQIYQGVPRSEYYPWELCFGVRNKTTDISRNGYGVSELEDLVRIITWVLNSDTYNGNLFTVGAAPKGILMVKNAVNGDALDNFKQELRTQVSGASNNWKIPILGADDVSWLSMASSNKDMEFSAFQKYLLSTIFAVFKMDPSEAGYDLGGGSDGNGVSFESSREYKLEFSKDKGFKPMMKSLAKWINKYLINRISKGKYEFYWTGLESDDSINEFRLDVEKLNSGGISLQDFYKKHSGKELDSVNDIVLNPTYIQYLQMKMGGAPESNEVIDEMTGEQNNPYTKAEELAKALNPENNPYNNFVEKGVQENNPFAKDAATMAQKTIFNK